MNLLNGIRLILWLMLNLCALNLIAQPIKPGSVVPGQTVRPGPNGTTIIHVMPGQRMPVETPLIIGVDSNYPPFSMKGGKGELYGFDISMMNSLCRIIKRNCQFKIMKFDALLLAVSASQVDLAVSSITITPERAKLINFSLPYALSNSRFLTNSDNNEATPFALLALKNKRIGVYKGTVYQTQAARLGLNNSLIEAYTGYQNAINALANKEVDYLLVDNPTALYWAANSTGKFKVVGPPIPYGFGVGIAVSNRASLIMPLLNKAILQYQESIEYKQNYRRYLEF